MLTDHGDTHPYFLVLLLLLLQAIERVNAREAAREQKRRSARAVEGSDELPADRDALFDDTAKGPLVSDWQREEGCFQPL